MNQAQFDKIKNDDGFIAALDQSGGSTPKALKIYGIDESAFSNDEEMFDVIHEMRSRIMTSAAFNGDRILGAILFENTMNRDVEGKPTAEYLWENRNVVPFLKIDKGLTDIQDDVQLLKPIDDLLPLLERANDKGIFGTKARSVIAGNNPIGIRENVAQQFAIAHRVIDMGLVPIIEPEVLITIEDKAEAEAELRDIILEKLGLLNTDQNVMLKLTLPDEANIYKPIIDHPRVLRVVALSGGYNRDEANARLSTNQGMVASFSRALTEGLSAQQSGENFDTSLNTSIQAIFDASKS